MAQRDMLQGSRKGTKESKGNATNEVEPKKMSREGCGQGRGGRGW